MFWKNWLTRAKQGETPRPQYRGFQYRATRATKPGLEPPEGMRGGGIMVNTTDGRVWVRAGDGYVEMKADTPEDTRRVADALAAGIDIGRLR